MTPEPIEFAAARRAMMIAALGSAGFVAAGVIMFRQPKDPFGHILGPFEILVFGTFFALAVKELLVPKVKLRIDAQGIHARMPFRGSSFELPWSEFAGVRVVTMSRQPIVVLDARDPDLGMLEGNPSRRLLKKANRKLVGSWMTLSPATYGLKTEDLIDAIERRRPT